VLKACLNGARSPGEHPALPVTAAQIAQAARAAVDAGADALHVHPKDPSGRDTLSPDEVGAVVAAVRAVCPGLPLGVTTGAWAEPDPDRRVARVRSWELLPDFASVNWHEEGAEAVATALLERSVGVEAGLWTQPAARAFRASPLAGRCLRVLLEPTESSADAALANAGAMLGIVAGVALPVLLHGEDGTAWPMLRVAATGGLDARIGLEDVLTGPDGEPVPDNVALVRAARAILAPLPGPAQQP
jgi:uncharacterized protein (DUF849 family)